MSTTSEFNFGKINDRINGLSDQIANKIDKNSSASLTMIEFYPSSGSGNGGYLDFHYNGDTSDYTSRIIENGSGQLGINGVKLTNGNIKCANDSYNINLATYLASGVTVSEYIKAIIMGHLVMINIGGLRANNTNAGATVFTIPNSLPLPITRPLCVLSNDANTKTTILYGAIGAQSFRLSAHDANITYFGQLFYFYD